MGISPKKYVCSLRSLLASEFWPFFILSMRQKLVVFKPYNCKLIIAQTTKEQNDICLLIFYVNLKLIEIEIIQAFYRFR